MSHNYARCQEKVCHLCDSYGDGYSRGKDVGVFESALAVIHWQSNPDCQCSPCTALRSVPLPTYGHD